MMADLDNPELSFQFVKVATEIGDLRGAISALERILLIKPNLANIKLELGILYLRLGANDLAETYIQQALDSPEMPARLRPRAEDLLARAQGQVTRHRFAGNVFVAGRYQTNATAAPASTRVRVAGTEGVLLEEDTAQEDYSLITLATGRYSYDLGTQSGDEIEANLLLYSQRYDESDDINVAVIDLDVGPRFFLGEVLSPDLSIRPFVSGSNIYLEDEQYLRTLGGGINVRYAVSNRLLAETTFEVRDRDFTNSDRRATAEDQSGQIYVLRGGLTYQLFVDTLIGANVSAARNESEEDFENFNEGQVTLSVTQTYQDPFELTAHDWSSSLSLGVRRTEFDDPEPAVDPNVTRDETRVDIRFTTNIPIVEDVTLVLSAQHTENYSNLPNFEFDNTSGTVGINWRF